MKNEKKNYYVTCKCGNIVMVEKRHNFSVLPCPECKIKIVVNGGDY